MGFSAKQVSALQHNINARYIRTREVNGRELSYIEGWYAIAEANRIFGFDGWNRETTESRCILSRENRGSFLAVYSAKIRITVHANGATIVREGYGTGEGRGPSPADVHDIALKSAETDATKRALATFGKPFGLALYGSGKTSSKLATANSKPVEQPAGLPPDTTKPTPRPSRYYGRRNYLAMREQGNSTEPLLEAAPNASLVPSVPEFVPVRIDKSVLTIGEPKRLRDKAHLRFVASQPCLICGRQPSDPHHLRFAQPRALGLKVSDEFTVPLCRGHHRQVHQTGNEAAWWEDLGIDALEIAKGLWEESHARPALSLDQAASGKSSVDPADSK